MWVIVLITIAVYCILISPIQQGLNNAIKDKKWNLAANLILAIIFFFILYGIAEWAGYEI